jgi:hypothetical protein
MEWSATPNTSRDIPMDDDDECEDLTVDLHLNRFCRISGAGPRTPCAAGGCTVVSLANGRVIWKKFNRITAECDTTL